MSAGGIYTGQRVFLNVVAGTCLQGDLHWPVSLPQNVVTGTGLQKASPLLVSIFQHVAAVTYLQGGSPLASESSLTGCSWDMSAGGIYTVQCVFLSML